MSGGLGNDEVFKSLQSNLNTVSLTALKPFSPLPKIDVLVIMGSVSGQNSTIISKFKNTPSPRCHLEYFRFP
jgi:hypothetical protein